MTRFFCPGRAHSPPDADGNLDAVTVAVSDASGTTVASATTDASGGSASGTDEFELEHIRGQTFDVTVTVTDAKDNSSSRTRTGTE